MKVCGVELKGNEAIICLLAKADGVFDLPDCRARTVVMKKSNDASDLKYFQTTFAKLMADYQINDVVIFERPTKGKFAGAASTFKMEAAIQLIDTLNVTLITATEVKESLKRQSIPVAFADTGLKPFQEIAFRTAFAFANL